jgi:ABC-2 type transport system permease protein
LYAILLAFTSFVFWSPAVLFTWIFDAVMQMARYPVGMYPRWVRLLLTWVIPVGLITTIPAQAISGGLTWSMAAIVVVIAAVLMIGASALFRYAVRQYASASS